MLVTHFWVFSEKCFIVTYLWLNLQKLILSSMTVYKCKTLWIHYQISLSKTGLSDLLLMAKLSGEPYEKYSWDLDRALVNQEMAVYGFAALWYTG